MIFIYLFVYLFLLISTLIFIYLFIHFHLLIYPSIYPSIYLFIHLPIYVSIYLSIYLHIYLHIYLTIYLSIYLEFGYLNISNFMICAYQAVFFGRVVREKSDYQVRKALLRIKQAEKSARNNSSLKLEVQTKCTLHYDVVQYVTVQVELDKIPSIFEFVLIVCDLHYRSHHYSSDYLS